MSDRVARLRAGLEEPLLVTNLVNVRYLTGFASSNAAVLVEPERTRLFTDFRYAEAARAVEGVELEVVDRAVIGELAKLLQGRVGFEAATVTYADWETLRGGGAELVPRTGLVEALRAVKDAGELDAIRRAAAVTDRVYERVAGERLSGRTESELAWRIEQLVREEGGEGLAFPVIVAAGENAARPHAVPGDRVLEAGQTVVIDLGARVGGYCSDCTRTFAVGGLDGRLADAYAVVAEAQLAGLGAVRAGTTGRDADAAARAVVDATGEFEGTFGHGLGHGVGLDVHEAPTLRATSDDVLEPGNVVSVEPGIYLPGEGGIRIEDLVAVADGEPEIFTRFPKELVTVA